MNAEIITIGSEILIGDILNTNSKFLSRELTFIGINVFWHSSVGDNRQRLQQAIELAISRSNLVVLTGGLGPTQDDLTREILAKIINKPLVENETLKKEIENWFEQNQQQMPANNLKQAKIFEDATIFKNKNGIAAGFAIKFNNAIIVALPGPSNEMMNMFNCEVKPFLQKFSNCVIKSKNVYVYGISESEVDVKLSNILNSANPSVGIYASAGEVRLRITCKAQNERNCNSLISAVAEKIEKILGDKVYGIDVNSMENALVQTALKSNKTIAVAESCTGGLIASKIVSIENASKIFKFGAVCYSDKSKEKILQVNCDDLKNNGAVSLQVAQQMALGVRKISNSDVGISTTGFAGFNPENELIKTPGLVFIGLSTKEKTIAYKLNFKHVVKKSRNKTIYLASLFAMNEARKAILKLK